MTVKREIPTTSRRSVHFICIQRISISSENSWKCLQIALTALTGILKGDIYGHLPSKTSSILRCAYKENSPTTWGFDSNLNQIWNTWKYSVWYHKMQDFITNYIQQCISIAKSTNDEYSCDDLSSSSLNKFKFCWNIVLFMRRCIVDEK